MTLAQPYSSSIVVVCLANTLGLPAVLSANRVAT